MNDLSQDTLAMFGKSYGDPRKGDPREFGRATTTGITQSTGLVWYDLQAPSKNLFPVVTPLRNSIPRRSGNGGTATNWLAVTGINVNKLRGGVPEGKRNGLVSTTTASRVQSYKSVGLEDSVSFEANNAALNLEDIRSRTGQRLLWASMIQEEVLMLGGNSDQGVALGTCPTPTNVAALSGGSIADGTYNVIAVALTHGGWYSSDLTNGVPDVVTVTMPNGSTFTYKGGSSQKSAAQAATITGGSGNGKLTATVTTPPTGTVAFAWYAGVAGSEKLAAITTVNTVVITTIPTTSQACASRFTADNSQNTYEYDGLLSQAFKSGSGAYIAYLATNTKLACSNNDASVDQIETMLKDRWDNYRLSFDALYVSAQELKNISALIMKNNGTPIIRLNGDFSQGAQGIVAGGVVGSYLNRYAMNGGQVIPLKLHPNVTPGTIMGTTSTLPYPVSGVANVAEYIYRQDWYQIDWPITQRQYETGVYTDGALAHYFPPALGIISNITDGI